MSERLCYFDVRYVEIYMASVFRKVHSSLNAL
jgi:hypothetical protein